MNDDERKAIAYEARRQVYLGIAMATGLFAVIVGVLLLVNQQKLRRVDPLDNAQLIEMKKRHQADPQNETLKNELRVYDLSIRQEYTDRLQFRKAGSYMLVGALALMLIVLHAADRHEVRTPGKDEAAPDALARNRTTRSAASLAVAVFGVLVLVLGSFRAPPQGTTPQNRPDPEPGTEPARVTSTPIPADYRPARETWLANWPCFRGPLQNGVARGGNAPVSFDVASGKNIVWKTKVPRKGFGSPIVWDGKVFLSGAAGHDTQEIYCFSTDDGKLLWTARIPPAGGDTQARIEAGGEAGLAAPTMITDGRRVCAIFATGDVACVDFDGKLLWSTNLNVPENHYGYASSLAYHDGLVFIQWDNRADRALIALNIADGMIAWETARDGEMSWSSPVVLDAGAGPRILTTAAPCTVAYNPADGKELWRCETLMGEVAPSVSTNGKLYFTTMQFSNLTALRPGGSGDITKTHMVWQYPDNLPDTSSPLATDEYALIADSAGFVTCVDIKTGAKKWEKIFETIFYPSPVLIDGKVYQLDNTGVLRVFEAWPEYKLLGESKLGESGGPSPAFVGGKLFIRGVNHLFCIAESK